ncbi:Alkaline phosphatase synthesis transcriptional regulatory protein PhoP [Microbacterium oxydans]|uniref:Alkaline phosphatase synthesis transcriptional regulatory protein PhoP n=1 Tax=Microbacterium oxydans TaxID=82380 RepID=A0A0F0LS88_9MICO|nr:response regulator transcription factor [Microbacterium oxydans]KJL34366.1 Alkaline phosphatase synthesis transcriptional regulatory protein PhoP [Microbacterium oxydans]CAH0261395.1 Alkaline phosphatase synthesis transcriptional regulatory protein PhoP [Microbacterium oxydans]
MITEQTERPHILLVDDDEAITGALAAFLGRSGFDVRVAEDGRAGLAEVERAVPDLVVCDVIMPHIDGREFVRRIRGRQLWLPIILLTQVGESWERSAALDEGADDYLNKPFDPHELISRIRAVLRRSSQGAGSLQASQRLRALDITVDRTARRVWRGDTEITLTPKALTLLEYLMLHPQEVHSRERLLSALWGFDFASSSRAVDHRIAELRRVLGDSAGDARIIETAQSLGYLFVPRVVSA